MNQRGIVWIPLLQNGIVILLLGALAVGGTVAVKQALVAQSSPYQANQKIETTWEKRVIDVINKERTTNGLTILSENNLLNKASVNQAQEIAKSGKWSSDNNFNHLKNVGYDYRQSGQSLARNFYSPEEVVQNLMEDPTNRNNILNKEYEDIGVSIGDYGQTKLVVIYYAVKNTLSAPSVNQATSDNTQSNNPQKTNNNQAITHNGTRTGPIVDYFELCTGKTIKIYENERIPYRTITGETVYSTKGDIKCYEDQIAKFKDEAYEVQEAYYQPPSTNYLPPSLPRYEPPKFNIPPPPKIEPFVPKNIVPTFPTPAPLKIKVEPEPCILVPPGFGGSTNGRVNEYGYPCAN